MGDWGRKPDKESINEKLPELDEKMWEENQKIVWILLTGGSIKNLQLSGN